MERPNVYVDPVTGAVQAFMLSCVPTKDTQSNSEEGANIIIWPVENWKPGDSTAMPHVRARARDVTVLPLGDSITENDHFRYALWKKFVDDGHAINMVGTRSKTQNRAEYEGQTFDADHDGYGGISAEWLFRRKCPISC